MNTVYTPTVGCKPCSVFANGFLSLWFGAIIVAFRDVWTGLPAVLTLFGWAQIVKALLSFVAPQVAMLSLQRVSVERAWEFQAGGAMLLVAGGLLVYLLAR